MLRIIDKTKNIIINKFFSTTIGTKNKLNRDEWLKYTLLNLPADARLLDAGAGQLRNKPLCAHLNYVSQDFGQYTGDNPKAPGLGNQIGWDTSNVDIISDITCIPEEDESFDAILCSEVFEHLPNPIAAMREFLRLLKPGGKMILTAPFNSLTHQAPFFYYSGFSSNFYSYWCNQLNFEIIDLLPNGNYFEYLGQELRRLDYVSQRYTNKKYSLACKIILYLLLKRLEIFSFDDENSAELLCFGYHLLAVKKKI